jgi:alpha-tubulin suppressor-like RCC1 family protein
VLSPVAIAGITDARGVYANGNQGFFENAAGQLYGWGQNGTGNLGIPDDDDQPSPSTPIFGLTGVLDVAIGALQGFAMKGDQAFGWGWSFHGSLGAGTSAIHTWPYRTPLLVAFPQ